MKDNQRSGPLDTSALHLLHRAGQCAEVLFTNETSKSDLTPRQYAVLVCVGQNPDVSQTGLVEQTGVDRSTLADVVRRLVKKGLLQRKRTKRDARMYAVRLTAKGQNILNSVKPQATKVDHRILSVLRSDQRANFIDALGDIVYLELPAVGTYVAAGEPCGEVESTKSVSELYAPADGEIVEVNPAVADDPSLVNSDPYGQGWLFRLRLTGSPELLDAAEYAALTGAEGRR